MARRLSTVRPQVNVRLLLAAFPLLQARCSTYPSVIQAFPK